jgi:protein gp37
MARESTISWIKGADGSAGATWNVLTGCTVLSPGCKNCYAQKLAGSRLKHHWSREGLTVATKNGPVWTGEVRFNRPWLYQPLSWRKPTAIFVCAHSDLFHPDVPDEWIDQIFAVMALCPQHVFMVLTKRPERMRQYLGDPEQNPFHRIHHAAAGDGDAWRWIKDQGKRPGITAYNLYMQRPLPLPNVWLGTSVEDQERADERLPHLLATPAALHWVSVEPMLGAVDITRYLHCPACGYTRADRALQGDHHRCALGAVATLDLVIAGGESQPGARWLPAARVRALRDQCAAAGTVFHFKQFGAWLPRDQVVTAAQREAIRKSPFEGAGNTRDTADAYNVGPTMAGHLLDGVEYRDMPPWPSAA